MKLQVALDCNFSVVSALSLLEKIADCVDIIEAGTPFIVESGLLLVRQLKEAFPEKQVSADLKIADAGHYEASRAFEAGADIATVLAMADDVTIMNARDAAHELGREIMVDMLNTQHLESTISACIPARTCKSWTAMPAEHLKSSENASKIPSSRWQAESARKISNSLLQSSQM